MQRRTFLAAGAAALAPLVVRPVPGLFAQEAPTAAATNSELRPPSTKPTPPEKIKQLKPIPANVAARAQRWHYRREIDGAPVNGEIASLTDDVVTLFDRGDFHDVVLAELTDEDQAAIARFRRHLENKATDDERKLLGSWKVVPPDSPEPQRLGYETDRILINTLQLEMHGDFGAYVLDAAKSPKQIDLAGMKGIYELKGDELRLCLNGVTDLRPVRIERGDGQDVLIARRLPDVSTLPIPSAAQYDPELKAFFEELLMLLEADDYAGVLRRSSPQAFAGIPEEKLPKVTTALAVHRRSFEAGMRALLRVVPKMSSDGTIAEFDLSAVHAAGISPATKVAAMKVDGRWYLKK